MNFKNLIKHPRPYFNKGLQVLKNQIRTQFYKGNKVICYLCGWEGQQFFDAKCPKCNALPRTRLIPYALQYFKLPNEDVKLLHIAPNNNEYTFIKRHIKGVSNYDRLNIRAVAHINIVQDLTCTNLKSEQYDQAIAWHVLEHIPEDLKAIKEVYRLLKPGGTFLVSVPIYPVGNTTTFEDAGLDYKDFEKTHGHYDHCRSCGLDYYKRFETIGFTTDTLEVRTLNSKDIVRFGLNSNHVVWCFTK